MLLNDAFTNFPSEENRKNYLNQIMSYPFEGFVQGSPDNPLKPVGMSNKKREEARSSRTWKEYYYDAMTNYNDVLGYVREGYVIVTVKGDIALKIRSMCIEEDWQCIMFADTLTDRVSLVFKNTDIQTNANVITAGGFPVDYCAYSVAGCELLKSTRVFDVIHVPSDLNTKNDSICEIPILFMPSHKRCGISFRDVNNLELHDWILGLAANGYDKDMLPLLLSQINSNLLDSPLPPEELRSIVTKDEMKSVVKYSNRTVYKSKTQLPDDEERGYVLGYKNEGKIIKISYDLFSKFFFSSYELGYMKGEQGRDGIRYQYNTDTGIWKPLVGDEVEKLIRAIDSRLDPDQISKATKMIKLDFEINPNVMQLNDKFDMEHIYLAFPNTTIEVSAEGIKEVERKKEYMLTSVFPFDYKKNMDYSDGEAVLDEIFSGDKSKELLFLQVGGVSMTRLQLKNMFYLTGDRDNGKSSLLNLWAECLADNQVSTLSMNQLSNELYVYGLLGRTVNIDDDERDGVIKNPELFKKLVGSGYMSGKQLYQNPVTFRNYATMVFACNDMPTVYNQNLQDKMVKIPFTAVFNSSTVTRERKLEVSRIFASDKMHEYLLSSFVGALQIYMANGRTLAECKVVDEASEEYREATKSPIQSWLSIKGTESEIIDMHGVTEDYCLRNNPKQITARFTAWYQDTYGMEPNIQDVKQALPAVKKKFGLKSSDRAIRGNCNDVYKPLIKK